MDSQHRFPNELFSVESKESGPLCRLPSDIQKTIFLFLDKHAQTMLASTSKTWKQKINLWQGEFIERDIQLTITSLQASISCDGFFLLELERSTKSKGMDEDEQKHSSLQCKSFSKANILYIDEYFVLLKFNNCLENEKTYKVLMERFFFNKIGKNAIKVIPEEWHLPLGENEKEEIVINRLKASKYNRDVHICAANTLAELFGAKGLFNKFTFPKSNDYRDFDGEYFWFFHLEAGGIDEQDSRQVSIEILRQMVNKNLIQIRDQDDVKETISLLQTNGFKQKCEEIVNKYLNEIKNSGPASAQLKSGDDDSHQENQLIKRYRFK